MTITKRFFRVTSGPLIESVREIVAEHQAASTLLLAFCKEIGAANVRMWGSGGIAGFKFDHRPDEAIWKKPNKHGLYCPKKNTPAGKDINRRMSELPKLRAIDDALETVGLTPHTPVLIGRGYGYSCSVFGSPNNGVMFVRVPWSTVSDDELAEYKKQRDSEVRTRLCMSLDHLLWEPTADMVEVAEWEVMRDMAQFQAAAQKEVA